MAPFVPLGHEGGTLAGHELTPLPLDLGQGVPTGIGFGSGVQDREGLDGLTSERAAYVTA